MADHSESDSDGDSEWYDDFILDSIEEVFELVKTNDYLQPLDDASTQNGFIIHDRVLPEEIFETILNYVPPEQLIHFSTVCKSWCRMIRSSKLWSVIYSRIYKEKTKKYPWYVFYAFFTGRLDNNVVKDNDGFHLECCLDTSYKDDLSGWCSFATTKLPKLTWDKLLFYIIAKHKPHLHLVFYNSDMDFSVFIQKLIEDEYKGCVYANGFCVNHRVEMCVVQYSSDFLEEIIELYSERVFIWKDAGLFMFLMDTLVKE